MCIWFDHEFICYTVLQLNPSPCRVLGVFGLSLYTTERELRDLFEKYGDIENIQIVYDHQVKWRYKLYYVIWHEI